MLHYNFPPYSVGEVRRPGGPSRRDIGHGNLAHRALSPVIPPMMNLNIPSVWWVKSWNPTGPLPWEPYVPVAWR